MISVKSIRRGALGLIAIGLFTGPAGCGMSTSHVALPLANSEAPKVWTPIMDCAKERGLKFVDGSRDAAPNVRVSMDSNSQLDLLYQVKGDHLEMELIIWGETTDADRKTILARMRKTGDEVWACAQQKMNAAPAASGTTAAAAVSASGSAAATPPP